MIQKLLKLYKKQIIFGSIFLVGIAWFVYAQVLLALVNVTSFCSESDGGFNIFAGGNMVGGFSLNTSNGSIQFSGVFHDACAPPGNVTNSTAVIEFVCGQNVAPQYSNLAAAIMVPCPTSGGRQGICANATTWQGTPGTGYCV